MADDCSVGLQGSPSDRQGPGSASPSTSTGEFVPEPSWMSWGASDFAPTPSSEAETVLAERRARNRDSMRRARQKKRSELQQLQDTVATLEKKYVDLGMRVASEQEQQQVRDGDENPSRTTQRLGAENLLLQASIQDQASWQTHIRRVLDADDERAASAAQAQELELEVTRRLFGFRHLMTHDCVAHVILESTEIVRDVHARLLGTTFAVEVAPPWYIFGWRLDRLIQGHEVEFVLEKQFINVSAFTLMTKMWENEMNLSDFRKFKADTRRLEVLQRVHDDAIVVGRDVKHEDDTPVFRTVYLRFRMARDAPSINGGQTASAASRGYVLGTQSINSGASLDVDGTDEPIVWVDMTFWTEFISERHPLTGEECCRVRWTGKTDYKSEAHAHRNAADVMLGVLRWERLNIAPVLRIC